MKKLLLVIPFLLVACDASHDVEWYKKHEKERKATIQECKKDGHCCKVSDEAAFCLIQRPYISKTLLT
ncbi:EexN family lipoprotein, partial [Klebsiella pneumoniae]|uniref:EexN family lipoprotein n=2 Tax=Klebsiella pneumoniae TaxID=573 RepID=UPI0022382E80